MGFDNVPSLTISSVELRHVLVKIAFKALSEATVWRRGERSVKVNYFYE
jgi:hypothetical protein